jgi:hypothetical protein
MNKKILYDLENIRQLAISRLAQMTTNNGFKSRLEKTKIQYENVYPNLDLKPMLRALKHIAGKVYS